MHARPQSKRFIEALSAAMLEGTDGDDLYRQFNRISLVPYNEGTNDGYLALSPDRYPSLIRLDEPVPLDNVRGIRKMLQLTSPALSALSNGRVLYGFGGPTSDLLLVRFQWPGRWCLIKGGKTIVRTRLQAALGGPDSFNEDLFRTALQQVFGGLPAANTNHLWNLMVSATRQQGGTNVLISANAAAEASRLGAQCTKFEPFELTSSIMEQVTSIDGTVVIDPDGKCFAAGAILDGASSRRGDRSRGGRYNSAIMYVDSSPLPSLILVVSKDGMIDLVFRQPNQSDR